MIIVILMIPLLLLTAMIISLVVMIITVLYNRISIIFLKRYPYHAMFSNRVRLLVKQKKKKKKILGDKNKLKT